ncbi:MAG: GDP-mannose 4,6-dehydratase [Proteobacteria bacterium]|nr:GDP-mannose 4,6-dehydratase [Pseudomonadota bacterium]
MPKKILLTGGLGFIGSHTVEYYLQTTDWHIIVIDSLSYAGRVERLTCLPNYDPDRVNIIWHDLRAPLHDTLIKKIGDVDYIVNMASDSHVDRSIAEPVNFINNNVALMLNMLEYAREIKPQAFIQVSTDEVYGASEKGAIHKENDPLRPSNPYAASKAAQEMIAFSYWRTFAVPLIITNTMNNFGERQDVEKFIPMTVRKILSDSVNTVHAIQHGGNWVSGSRVWMHAKNHADAIKFILEKTTPARYVSDTTLLPDKYNIAGDKQISNEDIVRMIGKIIGKEAKIEFADLPPTRPGHDFHYNIDGSKLKNLGWEMPVSTEETFERTIHWMVQNPNWL